MSQTKIEVFDHSINLGWGCKLDCSFCYAKGQAAVHAPNVIKYRWNPAPAEPDILEADYFSFSNKVSNFEPVFFNGYNPKLPKKKPVDVFASSMSDPTFWSSDWWLALFRLCDDHKIHRFFILSKRPGLAYRLFREFDCRWPANLYLGASATNQDEYNQRSRALSNLQIPQRTYIALEPLLGAVTIPDRHKPAWIWLGGQSGAGAPLLSRDWVRQVRDGCTLLDIPFFFKQWGDAGGMYAEYNDDGLPLLDGRIHDERLYRDEHTSDADLELADMAGHKAWECCFMELHTSSGASKKQYRQISPKPKNPYHPRSAQHRAWETGWIFNYGFH